MNKDLTFSFLTRPCQLPSRSWAPAPWKSSLDTLSEEGSMVVRNAAFILQAACLWSLILQVKMVSGEYSLGLVFPFLSFVFHAKARLWKIKDSEYNLRRSQSITYLVWGRQGDREEQLAGRRHLYWVGSVFPASLRFWNLLFYCSIRRRGGAPEPCIRIQISPK